MNVSGSNNAAYGANNASSQAGSSTKPAPGSSDDLLNQAEKIAREGFEMSLKAKAITNKYAAAKEVR